YYAPYPSRSLDTRPLQIYGTTLSELGEHQLAFQSTAYGTACTDTMSSAVVHKTVNVLQCGPHFSTFGGAPLHVAATSIDVYVPDDMYALWDPSLDEGPLKNAVDDWNDALGDLGLSLNLTTTQCSGGACIRLAHGPMAQHVDDCAETGV